MRPLGLAAAQGLRGKARKQGLDGWPAMHVQRVNRPLPACKPTHAAYTSPSTQPACPTAPCAARSPCGSRPNWSPCQAPMHPSCRPCRGLRSRQCRHPRQHPCLLQSLQPSRPLLSRPCVLPSLPTRLPLSLRQGLRPPSWHLRRPLLWQAQVPRPPRSPWCASVGTLGSNRGSCRSRRANRLPSTHTLSLPCLLVPACRSGGQRCCHPGTAMQGPTGLSP